MSAADGGAGPAMRVGHGYDAHPYAGADTQADRTLVLGGVRFPGERPLVGHSDADVVAHAVIDAMLSAAGLGDIGTQFPDSDERWRGADSIEMLRRVSALLAEGGWMLANADCTVICDRPMIAPHRDQMQERLGRAAGGPVTVCGKRTEGLGNADGIVAHAVALVVVGRQQ
ncbi:2-C-methyl-D-erythritol 2,4-cyclodiphosphate synthase [Candidatus Poriferisodalis sp.]|uniref:2-C-methyl-D-erythritol 2,4-cyclodiphosphate synthase n=1 Tax=Candidatus Poriferisodalis sp. TaxID=3101277 RepID=UPI003B026C6B